MAPNERDILTVILSWFQDHLAAMFEKCEAGQPRLVRHFRNEAANQARAVAMHSREELCCHDHEVKMKRSKAAGYAYRQPGMAYYGRYSTFPARQELSWQVSRLRELLNEPKTER